MKQYGESQLIRSPRRPGWCPNLKLLTASDLFKIVQWLIFSGHPIAIHNFATSQCSHGSTSKFAQIAPLFRTPVSASCQQLRGEVRYAIAAAAILIAALAAPARSEGCLLSNEAPQFSAPISGAILSGFGVRKSADGMTQMHIGVDYAAPVGEPVHAASNGQVTAAEEKDGYGLYISLAHSNGFKSAYAHLSEIKVHRGDCVHRGDVIGLSGKAKQTALLHFEVLRDDLFLDPESILRIRAPTP
jgi:murein DD-endopeptidase MepM/ murein hydrolase activator NlpD